VCAGGQNQGRSQTREFQGTGKWDHDWNLLAAKTAVQRRPRSKESLCT
jgi:hypothetical protein